jgi:hypothetical protein
MPKERKIGTPLALGIVSHRAKELEGILIEPVNLETVFSDPEEIATVGDLCVSCCIDEVDFYLRSKRRLKRARPLIKRYGFARILYPYLLEVAYDDRAEFEHDLKCILVNPRVADTTYLSWYRVGSVDEIDKQGVYLQLSSHYIGERARLLDELLSIPGYPKPAADHLVSGPAFFLAVREATIPTAMGMFIPVEGKTEFLEDVGPAIIDELERRVRENVELLPDLLGGTEFWASRKELGYSRRERRAPVLLPRLAEEIVGSKITLRQQGVIIKVLSDGNLVGELGYNMAVDLAEYLRDKLTMVKDEEWEQTRRFLHGQWWPGADDVPLGSDLYERWEKTVSVIESLGSDVYELYTQGEFLRYLLLPFQQAGEWESTAAYMLVHDIPGREVLDLVERGIDDSVRAERDKRQARLQLQRRRKQELDRWRRGKRKKKKRKG